MAQEVKSGSAGEASSEGIIEADLKPEGEQFIALILTSAAGSQKKRPLTTAFYPGLDDCF